MQQAGCRQCLTVGVDAGLSDRGAGALPAVSCAQLPGTEMAMKFMIAREVAMPDAAQGPGIAATPDAQTEGADGGDGEVQRRACGASARCAIATAFNVTRDGKRVRFDGATRSVVDGPFDGDLVAGYWIWDLPSMADAVDSGHAHARNVRCRCPRRSRSGRSVETRFVRFAIAHSLRFHPDQAWAA